MQEVRAPALLTEGIAADPCAPQNVIIVPAHRDVRYDGDDSSVLSTGPGPGQPARTVRARVGVPPAMRPRAGGRWRPDPFRNESGDAVMAQRALLDLHLSTRPDGAVVAG